MKKLPVSALMMLSAWTGDVKEIKVNMSYARLHINRVTVYEISSMFTVLLNDDMTCIHKNALFSATRVAPSDLQYL